MGIKVCRTCGIEFDSYPGKPGYIDECIDCTEERGGDVEIEHANDGGEDWQRIPRKVINNYRNVRQRIAPSGRDDA